MARSTLGYWDIRGLAEPIRYLLHYKGVDFEDKRYLNYDDWQNDKFSLNLDFPNLPYYIDDKVKLTQSTAILRYLARKFELTGKTEEEKVRAELAEQQIVDFRTSMIRTCYNPEYEKIKPEFVQNVPAQLKLFSAFLGDGKFLAGDEVTYVDFMAYDTFDFYRLLIPSVLNDFPNLKEYCDRFEKLPELQQYLESPVYKRWPIFGPVAYFGGKGTEPKRV
ncbi:glutathione S-transferase Mu 1-like [Uloborus diversus]|uniref:glutathione S-transferase Mu 1-like n=1 Tax=Uloborus diversus TaxID=327109 RepID=UPI0024093CBA|nr:glutathione S-transferase Mu 1-like [Uloborus diversus]